MVLPFHLDVRALTKSFVLLFLSILCVYLCSFCVFFWYLILISLVSSICVLATWVFYRLLNGGGGFLCVIILGK